MRDNLQKQFHESLSNAELQPPAGAWERIDAQLPQRKKRRPLLHYSAVLLFLVSASAAAFLGYNQFSEPGPGNPEALLHNSPSAGLPGSISPISSNHQEASQLYSTAGQEADVRTTPSNDKVHAVRSGNKSAAVHFMAKATNSIHHQAGMTPSNVASNFVQQTSNNTSAWVSVSNSGTHQESKGTLYSAREQDQLRPDMMLAYAGPELLPDDDFNKPIHAGLSPGNPLPHAFVPKRMLDDPEKIASREKRLKQFNKFDVHRGFHLGGFIGMNMTWMSRKYDLLEHEGNIIDPKTHVGLTFGLIAGYDINEKWGIQFEPALRNSKGQRFEETCILTGETLEKELTLRYFRFPLLLKYKIDLISGPGRRPMVLSVLAGPMFNILSQKIMLESDEPVYISPQFVNHAEFGAMAGIDVDFYINKNLYISAGSRLSVAAPFERQKPVSIQLGLHTQFNFRFPPKEKIKH